MNKSKAAIRRAIRCDDVKYDPWGTAMGWRFGIAHVLHAQDPALVPDAWSFSTAATDTLDTLVDSADDDDAETPDVDIAVMVDAGDTDNDALIYWGNVLARYTHVCERAGRSY